MAFSYEKIEPRDLENFKFDNFKSNACRNIYPQFSPGWLIDREKDITLIKLKNSLVGGVAVFGYHTGGVYCSLEIGYPEDTTNNNILRLSVISAGFILETDGDIDKKSVIEAAVKAIKFYIEEIEYKGECSVDIYNRFSA